jgi:hypothetical protein
LPNKEKLIIIRKSDSYDRNNRHQHLRTGRNIYGFGKNEAGSMKQQCSVGRNPYDTDIKPFAGKSV